MIVDSWSRVTTAAMFERATNHSEKRIPMTTMPMAPGMPVAMFAAALMTITLVSSAAAQQASARFRVLVPRIQPEGDADDDFGEDLANDLRDLIDEFATHQPVDEDEVEDAMDQFDMDWEDLTCVRTTQLASQISSQVILCGGYSEVGNDQYEVNVEFRVVEITRSIQTRLTP